MSEKRILVADADMRAGEEFRQALGADWVVTAATNGSSALSEMHKHPSTVVVADVNLPEIDGPELLNRIRKTYPRTIRFLGAAEEDKERVMKSARGAHQFLAKPYDRAALKNALERALATEAWVASDKLRELIAKTRTLPTVPSLYLEVVTALRSPSVTAEHVGAIIARDTAMTTKLLQVLNSGCFGLTRQVTEPAEAVGILGFETVKSMVIAIKLLNQYDKLKSLTVSVDRLWQHSTEVARIARQLALMETGDQELAELAFTSGLMHDLGKVVLAANFDEQYHGALLLGSKQNLSAWDVERDVFGANHGEVGAYLLGLWGLPLAVLEATALHHTPSRSGSRVFTALTAVHVANVLERESHPDELAMLPPKLDMEYLAESGLLLNLDRWREAVQTQNFAKKDVKSKPPPQKLSMKTTPDNLTPTEEAAAALSMNAALAGNRKWLYAGGVAAAGFTLLAVAGLMLQSQQSKTLEPSPKGQTDKFSPMPRGIQLRPAVPPLVGPQVAGTPDPEAGAVKPAETTPEKTTDGETALQVRARSTGTESAVRTNGGENAPTTKAAPAARPPLKELQLPEFKLQGIVYSAGNPSAIINGQNVRPNETVSGARVVEITATNVTLEYQGERGTLTLKPK